MNSYCAYHNDIIFPSSHSFLPERWLEESTLHLNRYLVHLERGPDLYLDALCLDRVAYHVCKCREEFRIGFVWDGVWRCWVWEVPHLKSWTKELRVLVKGIVMWAAWESHRKEYLSRRSKSDSTVVFNGLFIVIWKVWRWKTSLAICFTVPILKLFFF